MEVTAFGAGLAWKASVQAFSGVGFACCLHGFVVRDATHLSTGGVSRDYAKK